MLYRLLAVYGAAAPLQRRFMSFIASRASGKDRRRIQRVWPGLPPRQTEAPVWKPTYHGAQYRSAYLDSLRRVADLGAVLGIPDHGGLLEGADVVATSATATADHRPHQTDDDDARPRPGNLLRPRTIQLPPVHAVIPSACSVAGVHLLEAVPSGAARRQPTASS